MTADFYDFTALSLQGKEVSMADYKGKVVLVVNTASKCGLTPQFEGLEALYRKYAERGLVVLGFPCNQFANQEPGDESSISTGCVLNYGVTFPMFSKVDVNGRNAHPLFAYLRRNLKGFPTSSVKWNFTKFLLDKTGKPVKRFSPATDPGNIEPHILRLLAG
ncbi:MAG: glutathione peroxidase [Spirochaetales bacterium]|nr:glutathione peroxidase [Spirochaetales bacterium]